MGTNKRGRKFKEVMVLFLSENIGNTHVAFLFTGFIRGIKQEYVTSENFFSYLMVQ